MANNYPTEYGSTPVGRIVMCNREGIFAKGQTDKDNRPIPLDKQRYFVGLAVEKNAPGVNEMLGVLQKAAAEGYASNPVVMQQVQMGLAAAAFSWKVQDGDAMAPNAQTGQMEPKTPHARGCWIFKFSTTIDMRSAEFLNGVPVDCDPAKFYKGCYAMISYSASVNGNADHTAGIYLNSRSVCFVGHGEPIVGGPSLEQQFGAGPGTYVPAGMSQTPLAPNGAPAPGMAAPAPGMAPTATVGAAPAPGMAAPAPGMAAPAPGMAPTATVGAAPAPGMAAPAPGMAAPAPGMAAPAPGMADPMSPAASGGGMPAPNSQNMETGSPTDPAAQPTPYGGYMNPPAG